jgi:hypothetical protein
MADVAASTSVDDTKENLIVDIGDRWRCCSKEVEFRPKNFVVAQMQVQNPFKTSSI